MNSLMQSLRNLRGTKTQAEIAARFNVGQNTWSRWECGDRKPAAQYVLPLIKAGIPASCFEGDR